MKAFLQRLAEEVYMNHHSELDKICIVLPSRRSGLFFKRFLTGVIDQPVWLPEIYSIDDFVEQLTSTTISDPIRILMELYEISRKLPSPLTESNPEQFLSKGIMMINDFDAIDKSLSDPSDVFTYLTKARKIEMWNPGKPEPSEAQIKYLQFFESLYEYYHNLKANLEAKSMAYSGMLYRKSANIIENTENQIRWKKVIFAGFNALSKAEEKIFFKLKTLQKAEIYWDTDSYYMDNNYMEAGQFLRKYRSVSSNFKWNDQTLITEKKKIRITGIPSDIGMAKLAGQIIYSDFLDNSDSHKENTVIALADESLLIPLLSSLPPEAGRCNVTMGYPFTNTNFHEIIKLILDIRIKNEEQIRITNSENLEIVQSDFKKFINHPLVVRYLNPEFIRFQEIGGNIPLKKFKESGIFSDEQIISFLSKCFWPENSFGLLDGISGLIQQIIEIEQQNLDENDTNPEMEFAATTRQIIENLYNLIERYPEFSKTRTIFMIYDQLSRIVKIPFYGEPLSGLQIMGMLETRSLDFNNVIILSANEDKLPRIKRADSFLPLDIQSAFGIPTYKEQAAIYAYTFYRLIQKAENVVIIYNAAEDSPDVAEKSRFIRQMINEMPQINPAIEITESTVPIIPDFSKKQFQVVISKTPEILDLLEKKSKSGFSPTTLSRYIQCPLKFFLNDLILITEPDEFDEAIDSATFGSIVHGALARFYSRFINLKLAYPDIEKALPELHAMVVASALDDNHLSNIKTGKNYLEMVAIEKLCEKVIKNDLELLKNNREIIITGLEKKYEGHVMIERDGSLFKVMIKGTADRIQKEGRLTRIIDYKTGKVDSNDLKVSDSEMLITDAKKHKALQLSIYEWLFMKNHPEQSEVIGSILSLKNFPEGFIDLEIYDTDSSLSRMEVIETKIKDLLCSVFDVSMPFTQTDEKKNCEYCEFRTLCDRH